jgi:hypothetical protein
MGLFPYYCESMGIRTSENPVVARVSRYLDRLFDRLGDRVGDRVADRLEATVDVATDPMLLKDLHEADAQADEDARPYDEIRREVGLA